VCAELGANKEWSQQTGIRGLDLTLQISGETGVPVSEMQLLLGLRTCRMDLRQARFYIAVQGLDYTIQDSESLGVRTGLVDVRKT
jgi:hypothetical protein